MKNQPKFDVSLQPPRFTIHSLMLFLFDKFLTDNLKTYGLMDPVNFLENVLLDVLKKCSANSSALFCYKKCCSLFLE